MTDHRTQKNIDKLVENKMSDGENVLLCTTYNINFGAKLMTIYGDNMFVSPAYEKIENVLKIEKSVIEDMFVKKSFWKGNKLFINIKTGEKLMYRLVHRRWIPVAERIINNWLKK